MRPPYFNRANTLKIISKRERQLIKAISDRCTYKLPKNYIGWEELEAMIALALTTCDEAIAKIDYAAFLHSHRMALWFIKDAPLYCLTPEFFDVLDNTDVLNRAELLKDWMPKLPSKLIAIPKGKFKSPEGGTIDYLIINCSSTEHLDWEGGEWNGHVAYPLTPIFDVQLQWLTCDRQETVWYSGVALKCGELIHFDNNMGKSPMSNADKNFLERTRNLMLNILLAVEFQPELIIPATNKDVEKSGTGFAVKPNYRLPRWLGKGYRIKQQSEQSIGTHASPRCHWRRGHWRQQACGVGRSDHRWVFIDPVLINSDR